MCKVKPCRECANYKTTACMGKEKRIVMLEDYSYDCFLTEEDKMLCELMCGGEEDD